MPKQHWVASAERMEGTAWGRKENTNSGTSTLCALCFLPQSLNSPYVSNPQAFDVHKITREGRDSCSKCKVPSLDEGMQQIYGRANEAVL